MLLELGALVGEIGIKIKKIDKPCPFLTEVTNIDFRIIGD